MEELSFFLNKPPLSKCFLRHISHMDMSNKFQNLPKLPNSITHGENIYDSQNRLMLSVKQATDKLCDVSNKQLHLPRSVSVVYMQNEGPFFFLFPFSFFAKRVCHREISASDGMDFSGAAAGFKHVTQSAPLYQHLQSAAQLETLSTFYPSLSRQKRSNTLFSQSGVEYDTQCISALIGVDFTPFYAGWGCDYNYS